MDRQLLSKILAQMRKNLKEGKEILNLASGKNLFKILQFEFPYFIKKRIKSKIPSKIITERTKET